MVLLMLFMVMLVNLVDLNEGTSGGYKEIIFEVNGEDVYGNLKFEACFLKPHQSLKYNNLYDS